MLNKWYHERKAHPLPREMIRYFNAFPSNSTHYDLESIKDVECSTTEISTSYYVSLRYSIENYNPRMRVVKAFPFNLFTFEGEFVCPYSYIGQRVQIFDEKYGMCPHPALNPLDKLEVLIEPSIEECIENTKRMAEEIQWQKESCVPKKMYHQFSPQVKKSGQEFHVFCNGRNITIGAIIKPCPNHVFKIPEGLNFAIQGSNITWKNMPEADTDSSVKAFIDSTSLPCSDGERIKITENRS